MTRGEERANTVGLNGRTKGWPNWTTPEDVLNVVREVNYIGLDPCSNGASLVNAVTAWDCEGLEKNWSHSGLTFVNPPYNQAKEFVAKCLYEANGGCEIILLVAARTDTKWAHSIFQHADALCFWGPGRIRFGNPPPDSPGDAPSIPSMFAYWGQGERVSPFLNAFAKRGHCVNLRAGREKPRSFPVQVRP